MTLTCLAVRLSILSGIFPVFLVRNNDKRSKSLYVLLIGFTTSLILFQIRLKDYEKFQFVGAKDLTAMFEFYQTAIIERDIKLTKRLNPYVVTFDKWIAENKDAIEEALKES